MMWRGCGGVSDVHGGVAITRSKGSMERRRGNQEGAPGLLVMCIAYREGSGLRSPWV